MPLLGRAELTPTPEEGGYIVLPCLQGLPDDSPGLLLGWTQACLAPYPTEPQAFSSLFNRHFLEGRTAPGVDLEPGSRL
jgi:hypothetical protein